MDTKRLHDAKPTIPRKMRTEDLQHTKFDSHTLKTTGAVSINLLAKRKRKRKEENKLQAKK